MLLESRQPAYSSGEVERGVSARIARPPPFVREPAPTLSFVQEEASLRRPIGGKMAWRHRLERPLEIGRLRAVSLQVMPLNCERLPWRERLGSDHSIAQLKDPELFEGGDRPTVERAAGAADSRSVTELQ